MASTYTTNRRLRKPASNDTGWGTTVNLNTDELDAVGSVGGLAVVPTETPSASLAVKVAAGKYRKLDGTVGNYAGTASQTIAASSTVALWLTDSGTLTSGASYPITAHARLATVTTDGTTVTSIVDDGGIRQVLLPQPAHADQAAAAALTSATLTDSTTGTANATVTDVGGSFVQATLNNNFADLTSQVNALRVDLSAVRTLVNQMRADLVAAGIIKGSA